jgi:hypothetical protein
VADRPVGAQVGFLQGVFGLGIVAQDRARGAEEHAVVPAHEPGERGGVSATDAARKLGPFNR